MRSLRQTISHSLRAIAFVALLPAVAVAEPIRPLANEFVIVGKSPAALEVPLYSPSILRLESGRLVGAYTRASTNAEKFGVPVEVLLTSDDHGVSWMKRAELPGALQGRVFAAGRALYYVATGAGMPVSRSDDNGVTWSK